MFIESDAIWFFVSNIGKYYCQILWRILRLKDVCSEIGERYWIRYVSTVYGKHNLPGNKNKTIEGTTGFAAGAIFALLAMPVMLSILKAAMATIIESLPLKTNGDLALPASSSLLYYIIL